MRKSLSSSSHAKVFYRPIEAAIRWAGLSRFEHRILLVQGVRGTRELPEHGDFPRWPQLRLNAERILDALINGEHRQLNTLLLHAADGRLRLRNLLPIFDPHYDLVLIDTQGARSVLLEMAVLASDLAVSPVTPEILAARELRRGTLQLLEEIAPYRHLGIQPSAAT